MTIRSFDNQKPVIHESAWIDPSAFVAGRVTLGEDVSVWPNAVIRGDVNTISVGSKRIFKTAPSCIVPMTDRIRRAEKRSSLEIV